MTVASEPVTETLDDDWKGGVVPTALPAPLLFRVIEGARPCAGGSRHALDGVGLVTIGRGRSFSVERRNVGGQTQLELRIPGGFMSQTHAFLRRSPGGDWLIEDAGSKNGTFVGGRRVNQALLRDGDVVELGHTFFILRTSAPCPPEAPADANPGESGLPVGFKTTLPALAERFEPLQRVATSNIPVLLLGQTGTGKEVLAREIHRASGRPGQFVAVNCGALPGPLVESLLFGHLKGSFSGASSDELGFLRSADRGTLLLDEIGDLPLPGQVALLRALQDGLVLPIGATRPVQVDIRIIAATHRPVEDLAARGLFRSDLLARLKGYAHHLSPLHARREDLGVLLADILPEIAGSQAESVRISPEAIRSFLGYGWPLNVRELQQAIRTALLLAGDGPIELHHLPPDLNGTAPPLSADRNVARPELQASARVDGDELREQLVGHLTAERGNVAAVARAMGKAPFQIHRWMKRFGIMPDQYRPR